jgi:hypothetical protein
VEGNLVDEALECVKPWCDREQTACVSVIKLDSVIIESERTMLNNAKSTMNKKNNQVEPSIYLNKAEAISLWTNDMFREKLLLLCSPQGEGIKRLQDLEVAVIRFLYKLSPATKRTLGHAGGLRR